MKKTLLLFVGLSVSFLTFSQKSQIDLPITWDDSATVDYSTIGFGSDTAYLAADPTNASNIVLEVLKPSGAQTWAGVVLGSDSLASAIPFSAGNTVMQIQVYTPVAGTPIRVKVEDETNGSISVETEVNSTSAGWNTMNFDFANNVAGTPAINFSNTYDKIAVFLDFGTSPSANEIYYIDSVSFIGGGGSGPSKAMIDLPITWDDTANVDYSTIDFGGNVSTSAPDPSNASNIVLKADKPAGAQTWAGTTFGNALATPTPFSAGNTIVRARVYSSTMNTPIRMKFEDSTDPTKTIETEVNTTMIGWDTLTFDMSMPAMGTNAINFANTFDKVSMFFNFGTSPSALETYYVDDVWFGTAAVTKMLMSLPITWDDTNNVDYSIVDFGGAASTPSVDPNNAMNAVLKTDKTAGAQTWGGTSFGNSLAAPIPFSMGNTILTARVYSPASGVTVLLKAEDQTNGALSVETSATTSKIGWDTLTFDFNNNAPMTPAINFTQTYDKLSIFYNFGVSPAATETYYVDNVSFGPLATGLDLIRNNETVSVYPNPATNFITIESNIQFEGAVTTEIFNSVGQVVYSTNAALNNAERIDVSEFENGFYILSIQTESGRSTSKFFVSK